MGHEPTVACDYASCISAERLTDPFPLMPDRQINYRTRLITLILIASLVRMLIASSVELGNAEVYYWVYSLKLQWNYFDHPPMVGWLIRLTTINNLLHNELSVRIGATLCSALCTYLIFRIGTLIDNLRTGWYAALLYTASFYASVAAGAFILPDSPQMVFWLAGILILIRLVQSDEPESSQLFKWCCFGLLTGLCIMSKAHGAFLWLGVALFALLKRRSWFRHSGIYMSFIITCVVISPIIIWNAQNHFATYKFHGSRVLPTKDGIDVLRFMKQLFAVILIMNPVNFYLTGKSLVLIWKGKFQQFKNETAIILFCSLPLIAAQLIISFYRVAYPHWPGPAYSSLLLLPAIMIGSKSDRIGAAIPGSIKFAFGLLIFVFISQILITNYYPGSTSGQEQTIDYGKGDQTLDMFGWQQAAEKFDSLYNADVRNHVMNAGSPIFITQWNTAAHIDFYVASKTNQQTIGIGPLENIHQYFWINSYRKPLKEGDSGYYLIPSNEFDFKSFDQIIKHFESHQLALTIPVIRSGAVCKNVYVFWLRGYQRNGK